MSQPLNPRSPLSGPKRAVALAAACCLLSGPVRAADTDIYGATGTSGNPSVIFLLDNTSNWSSSANAWNSTDSYAVCKANYDAAIARAASLPAAEKAAATALANADLATCKTVIQGVYYPSGSPKYPWDSGYNTHTHEVSLKQGQVELRTMVLVLKQLVCSGAADALKVNVGLSILTKSTASSMGDPSGIIHFAVQALTGTASSGTCKTLIDKLNNVDANITSPSFKAPSNANYSAPMYEIFKYLGGHSNPDLAGAAASPTDSTHYGPARYSLADSNDDPAAFTDSGKTTYLSPITAANACSSTNIVLIGNGYPNAESSSTPIVFSGMGYTVPTLSPTSSDTSRYADEWAYFLAKTDVSSQDGIQSVKTYTVNVFKDHEDTDQTKLLKSMADVGDGSYYSVGGDLNAMVDAFKDALIKISGQASVFSAVTLPVSTTTQGTFLNQIFVGMFRPDETRKPRWYGNLKQYELNLDTGVLSLYGADSKIATSGGFFAATAKSFWTADSVYFNNNPLGTPLSISDNPDGAIVEKGGAAQRLREQNLTKSDKRNIYTQPAAGALLSTAKFDTSNATVTAVLDNNLINWVRGEANNNASTQGKEEFVGAQKVGATATDLGATGVRPSVHGDVLHSRPVALNYGLSGGVADVVVYYGGNDFVMHAVDGRKTVSGAGEELWSFVAPEFYDKLQRARDGEKILHLPENDSTGAKTSVPSDRAAKDYGMDGPIGVYALYDTTGAVSEAIIYPTMRRGGQVLYAFDVSIKDKPTYLWKITPATTGFSRLAQTWSMAKPVLFKGSSASPPVMLIMGGGYDPAEDSNTSSGIGNAIYIINGRTGALVKALSTDYSVPSDVTVVDVNGDGDPDRAYVADVRGNLYRVDFPSGDLMSSATWASTSAVKIATLGGKVFYPPDVVATKGFVAVLTGTGDREKPLMNTSADHFFLIKDMVDAPRASALTISDLTQVARVIDDGKGGEKLTDVVTSVTDDEGCYITLATNGEKVVNAPFTITGVTYFGTNRPTPSGAAKCTADLGQAYNYSFPLFCGAPGVPNPIKGGGLPPTPVGGIVELTVGGKTVRTTACIGCGTDSPFKPIQPVPTIQPVRKRLTWRIDNTNK